MQHIQVGKDAEQNVIILTVVPGWTWEEFNQATEDAIRMGEATGSNFILVSDLTKNGLYMDGRANFIVKGKPIYNIAHESHLCKHWILVGKGAPQIFGSQFLKAMNLAGKVFGQEAFMSFLPDMGKALASAKAILDKANAA